MRSESGKKRGMSLTEEERLGEFIALDAKLKVHLQQGGGAENPPATEWMDRMVALGVRLSWVQPILESWKLPESLLARAYRESLQMLMPNPLVQTETGPRLVPSLLYLDADVFPNLVSREGERLAVAARSEDTEELLEILRQEAQRLYQAFTRHQAPVPLATNDDGGLGGQGGCSAITLRSIAFFGLGAAWLKWWLS